MGSVLLGIIGAIVVWNLIVSATLWNPTGYQAHPVLGRIYRPGWFLYGVEGFSLSRMNSLGLRGPEIAERQGDEVRVLFLGDSLTEGLQVPLNKTFALRAGEALEQAGTPAYCINAGRTGASPADYLGLSDWYTEVADPDVTVIQVSEQDFYDDLENPNRRFYVVREGTEMTVTANAGFETADPLLRRFGWLAPLREAPLVSLAAQNVEKAIARRAELAVRDEADDVMPADEAAIDWTVSQLALEYPHLVLVYLPEMNLLRGAPDTVPIQQALARASARHGVEFVDMRETFIREFTVERVAPTGFANSTPGIGHLNAHGHELVAAELVPAIERVLAR